MPTAAPAFAVAVQALGTTLRIAFEGELDIAGAAAARPVLADVLRRGAETVLLDLGGLSFMDSSGVHAVLDAARHAEEARVRFVVLPAPADVQDVFALCGVEDRLPFAR